MSHRSNPFSPAVVAGLSVVALVLIAGTAGPTHAQEEANDLPLRHAHDPILEQLGRAGVEPTPGGLMDAVRSHEREVIRMLAARTLARDGVKTALPVLADVALADPSETVRGAATAAVCQLGGAECADLAEAGLKRSSDPAEQLRWATLRARHGGDPALGVELYEALLADPDRRLAAIGKSFLFFDIDTPGFDVVEGLVTWADDDDPKVRAAAVDQLAQALRVGRIDLAAVEELLIERTHDDDETVRERAEIALDHGRLHQAKDRSETAHEESR